jgi:hypothetical protein
MPKPPEKNDNSSIQQAAERHAQEILARRRAACATRAAALTPHLSNDPGDYKAWWANELHPTGDDLFGARDGFGAVATKFQAVHTQLP